MALYAKRHELEQGPAPLSAPQETLEGAYMVFNAVVPKYLITPNAVMLKTPAWAKEAVLFIPLVHKD